MRKTVLAVCAMSLGLGLGTACARADQLALGPSSQTVASVPDRGLSMAAVEKRYGAPSDRLAAIGKPPITRWVYPSFVVYFEYNLVIHSVATQPAAATN
ncbi:MAG TPA: hypothetical protein PL152_07115 [Steroidobacteraceae bacterium]|nr:hypothetical protein [Steroidobacteraceae bacterium]